MGLKDKLWLVSLIAPGCLDSGFHQFLVEILAKAATNATRPVRTRVSSEANLTLSYSFPQPVGSILLCCHREEGQHTLMLRLGQPASQHAPLGFQAFLFLPSWLAGTKKTSSLEQGVGEWLSF